MLRIAKSTVLFIFLIVLFLAVESQSFANEKTLNTQNVLQKYARAPLYFIQNQGVYPAEVLFYLRNSKSITFFTENGVTFTAITRDKLHTHRLNFVGARPSKVFPIEKQAYKVHYLIGANPKKWKNNISTFGKIVYHNLYPNIDLTYCGKEGSLKYEYIVKVSGDLKKIKLSYENIKSLSLDKNGDLLIETDLGTVRDTRPFCYQIVNNKMVIVSVRFRLTGKRTYGFESDKYNPKYPLVIDPLKYSTFIGGAGQDIGMAIALDSAGNAYITGNTYSIDFSTTTGAYDESYNGGQDVFVTKLNADGSALVYSTFIGGLSDDEAFCIALDKSTSVYISGRTTSTDFPTTAGAYDESFNGQTDAFVTKLHIDGSALFYSTFLGSVSDEKACGIAVDDSNNAYITGQAGSDFPTTVGAYDETNNGNADVFVTKLNSTGTAPLVYSTFLGGVDKENDSKIAVDNTGNAYILGVTNSVNFPTTSGAYDESYNGGQDVFVTKLNAAGSALGFSTFLGGTNDDGSEDNFIALDASNNVYVSDSTNSADFPTTAGAYDETQNGGKDVFVTKLNNTGAALDFSTFLGGTNNDDNARGIALDGSNNVYIVGRTYSADFPTTTRAYNTSLNGGLDIFISKLQADGSTLMYSTFLGENADDYAYGIAVDDNGNAYITGVTFSADFPTTSGAYDRFYDGQGESFITKIEPTQEADDDHNDGHHSSSHHSSKCGATGIELVLFFIFMLIIKCCGNLAYLDK